MRSVRIPAATSGAAAGHPRAAACEPADSRRRDHRREVGFRAPYPVTSANQGYFLSARIGRHGLAGSGSDADVARSAIVSIPIGGLLALAHRRSIRVEVTYTRFGPGIPESTPVGTVIVREPPGTHAAPLSRRG